MKTKLAALSVAAFLLCGCAWFKKPEPITVVTPVGPATAQLNADVSAHLAATDATLAKVASALSQSSASAGAIKTINTGQPPGPRTDGVAGEAGIIQNVAGQPTAADQLAASERARVVAEGKAQDIAAQYQAAQTAALAAQSDLASTKAALAAQNAALAKAQADAQTEQAGLAAKLQAQFDATKRDADARVAAAQSAAKAAAERMQTVILTGLGALLILAGIASIVYASSIPFLGPRAGALLIGAGVGLITLNVIVRELQDQLDRHPWVLWTGVGLMIALVAVAAGMIYSNQHHAADALKTALTPVTDAAKAKAESVLADAKAEAAKLIADAKAKLGITNPQAPTQP